MIQRVPEGQGDLLRRHAQQVLQQDCREVAKAQKVRLFDVFVIGPGMIAAGVYSDVDPLPRWMKRSLVAVGTATVFYNARNYRDTARGLGVGGNSKKG